MHDDYDIDMSIAATVALSHGMAELARAHSQSTDEGIKEILTVASRICLQYMLPKQPPQSNVYGIDGGKVQ